MSNYTPISCSIYDQLESLAVLNASVTLTYLHDSEEQVILTTKIFNLQTIDHIEYLITAEGVHIRLDHLLSINQLSVSDYCVK